MATGVYQCQLDTFEANLRIMETANGICFKTFADFKMRTMYNNMYFWFGSDFNETSIVWNMNILFLLRAGLIHNDKMTGLVELSCCYYCIDCLANNN
jgi:hypothetical protein